MTFEEMMHTSTKWAALAAVAVMAAWPEAAQAGELKGLRSNAEVEAFIEGVAIAEMEKQVEAPPVMYRRMAATSGAAGGASHSTTNVQVAGVDEPDFVKNDGEYIYKITGEAVAVVDASPAWLMREVSRIRPEGYPHALFLSGKTLVVFTNAPAPRGMERPQQPGPWWGGGMVRMMSMPMHSQNPVLKATLYDVTDARRPKVAREYYLEGDLVGARMVGTEVHMVTTARTPGPELKYWTDWSRSPTAAEIAALKAENRRLITAATLDDWMPRHWDKANAVRPVRAVAGGRCWRPETAVGRQVLTVTTLDVATKAAPRNMSLVAEAGELYASAGSLYVATYQWRYWQESGVGQAPGDKTEIHRFRIGLSTGPRYDSTGEVEGRVLDQFAMDEWNGMLRVATTTDGGVAGVPQANHVFVLKSFPTLGRKLWKIGEIRDMAPTERIYAVRFMGERGFVVTFKQVDPLFAIDMRRLVVRGELKIDGFSTYLHPVGANHLLAVGNAVDPSTMRVTGLDVSLFDVSDMANPRLAQRKTLPGAYSASLYEHKAFNYFAKTASTGTLAIPVNDWQNGFSGLEVYSVSTTGGVSLSGRIDHAGMAKAQGWGYGPECSRSVIIGPAIYAISDVGISSSRLANPSSFYAQLVLVP